MVRFKKNRKRTLEKYKKNNHVETKKSHTALGVAFRAYLEALVS